jgi:hypothetical protein
MDFTKDMAEELFTRLTGAGIDCALRERLHPRKAKCCYEIQYTFKEVDAWWRFTVVVPRYAPDDFSVRGHRHNPGYTHDIFLQHRMKLLVERRVTEILCTVLTESPEWQAEQREAYDEYVETHGG